MKVRTVRRKHDAVLADCPWEYRNFTESAHGAAESQYKTMTDDAIAAIPVSRWTSPNAVLFLWATWPRLDIAMRVLHAWGFTDYVTGIPWVKTTPSTGEIRRGVGFWAMAASEVLLIARRGEPHPKHPKKGKPIGLLTGENPRIFYAPTRKHSAKPLDIHTWIEGLFPGGHFLEMFARKKREGWDCWGNELGFELSAEGVKPCTPVVNSSPQQRSLWENPT